MSERAEKLYQELRLLSQEERDDVVCRLSEDDDDPAENDPEYAAELQRRIEDHECGRTKALPWQEARKIIFAGGEDDAAS